MNLFQMKYRSVGNNLLLQISVLEQILSFKSISPNSNEPCCVQRTKSCSLYNIRQKKMNVFLYLYIKDVQSSHSCPDAPFSRQDQNVLL